MHVVLRFVRNFVLVFCLFLLVPAIHESDVPMIIGAGSGILVVGALSLRSARRRDRDGR